MVIPSGDRAVLNGEINKPEPIILFGNDQKDGTDLYLNGEKYFRVQPDQKNSRVFVLLHPGNVSYFCAPFHALVTITKTSTLHS